MIPVRQIPSLPHRRPVCPTEQAGNGSVRQSRLSAVTALDADKLRSWLKGDKKTKSGMGLNGNSARSIVKSAKRIFGAAVRGKLLVENPSAGHSTAIIERPDRVQLVDLERSAAC